AGTIYLVCGDGTLVDNSTGLMWELKDTSCGAGDVHCVNNTYTWSGASFGSTNIQDGTLFTVFLATLNDDVDSGSVNACFANHCDWRIPRQAELVTIVEPSAAGCGGGSPCIDPAFDSTGYSTQVSLYWSSSSYSPYAGYAWKIFFGDGSANVY